MSILPTVLPRLQGVWLALFRLIWCVALALALFAAIGATWTDARAPSLSDTNWQTFIERQHALGIRLLAPVGPQTWRVMNVFSAEATSAGVRAGDQILAINGRPVTLRTAAATMAESLSRQEGHQTTFRLRAVDGSVNDRVLVYRRSNTDAWYRGSGLSARRHFLLRRVAYDLMTMLLLAVSSILFLRRSHEVVAAAFSLGLCLMPIGPTVEFWFEINAFGVYQVLAAIPYVLLLMIGCAFPDGRYWPPWTRFSLVVAPALLLPATFLAFEYTQFTLYAAPGFLTVITILALRYRRLPQGAERQQFRWAAFGLAAGVILLIARLPYAAIIQANLSPSPLSPWIDVGGSFLHALGYAVIGAGFGVALLKYRLYDAELLISRSAAITAATLMLAGLWAASEKALETLLPNLVGQQYASLAGIFSAGFAVILVTSLHGRLQRLIEKRFHKGVYRLKEELPKLLDALTLRFHTRELCDKVLSDIARDVRVTKAAILLHGNHGLTLASEHGVEAGDVQPWLEIKTPEARPDEDASVFSVAVPLVDPVMDEKIGWLLVGPRPDGTTCNRDERAALASVAPPIARAIATVQARDHRENP